MSGQELIINADDFGLTGGVNRAIEELLQKGIVTSTSVMSNMPSCEEIVNLKGRLGIGVHLNLTTGKPILPPTTVATLVDDSGTFLKLSELLSRLWGGKISRQHVVLEMKTQIRRLLELDVELDHLNSHQSLLKYPYFFSLFERLAKDYDIPSIRTYRGLQPRLQRFWNAKKLLKSAYLQYQRLRLMRSGFCVTDRFDSLLQMGLTDSQAVEYLRNLAKCRWRGVLELAVHPAYCYGRVELLGAYQREREIEHRALIDSGFRILLAENKVDLIRFSSLAKGWLKAPRAATPINRY